MSLVFIIWGKKKTERFQGAVADFCPICRDLRAFHLIRIGLTGHIYKISFMQGELVGHMIECMDCGMRLNTEIMRYASIYEKPVKDLEVLIQITFPAAREVYAERLKLEVERVRSSVNATSEQRAALILEPFELLNPT